MKKKNHTYITLLFIIAIMALALFSCHTKQKNSADNILEENHLITTSILTKEQQESLTIEQVMDSLKKRNEDFVHDRLTIRNNSQRIREASIGQYPKAVVLSCLDSRVPVEDVFHSGIGDLFVARVAGNVINEDILGSLEYACKVSKSKVIVVLGHEYCGAIKSAIDDVELGNITPLLSKIKPAIEAAKKDFDGEATSKNPAFVQAVCDHNVHHVMDGIRQESPILKEMEDKGEIKIIGGIYDMETGKVTFLE